MSKKQGDQIFLFCFFILIIIGLIVLTSVSFGQACQRFNDCYFYLKHQLLRGFLPGVLFFLFFSILNYHHLKKIALPFLVLSIILLVVLFIPGAGIFHGSSVQWLDLKLISFQPSEIVKLSLIIYLSSWLVKNAEGTEEQKRRSKKTKKSFLFFIIFLGLIEFLIIKQPDYGAATIIFIFSLILYFAAETPIFHSIIFLVGGILSFFILIFFSPYHLSRVTTFLNPALEPGQAGYQINQALLAIGAGGLFGRGLGHSIQKFFYLPEVISDSIFAVMSEELGFILTVLILGLYLYLTYRIFKVAAKAPDKFGQLLAVGIDSWFIVQSLINMAGMLNLLPLAGVTLPFISYGGTSFCVFSAAFGIVYNISRQKKH